jgi:alpha-L-fucosidase
MFIHWGLYSLGARHEWLMSREEISRADYQKYFKHFDPDLYNPELWAKAAADAGMKYFVVTTKHHEGFCLWDSKLTDYKATNTPHGKDLIRPMVDAFTRHGLRTGFYHSLIDWQHPDYVVDNRNHPDRNQITPDTNQGRDQAKYAKYLRDQVAELLTHYKPVDILWFDFSFIFPEDRHDFSKGKGREAWESEKLYKVIRDIAPHIILTDRLDMDIPLSGGDMKTPEQVQPRSWVTIEHQGKQVPVVWEACQTFSGSWGYHRDENTWRSTRQLIITLIDCVSKGGNLLLNVGPTGRGEFDARAMDRLAGIGRWMRHHSRAIYNCTQAPPEFVPPQDTRLTYNPEKNRLYIHLLNWPFAHLHLDGQAYADRVEYAQLLNDASELRFGMSQWHKNSLGVKADQSTLTINLPQTEPLGVEVPVIELFLKP